MRQSALWSVKISMKGINQMKRIGIFLFYDAKGIVDEYKVYLLYSLKTVLSDLIIVVNGRICDDGLAVLRRFSEDIYIRDNIGFDGGVQRGTY